MTDDDERGMTPAEFKTAHESLGVSTAFLSERIGVVATRIWAYESPGRTIPVPKRASDVMRDLLVDFDAAANEIEEAVRITNEGFIPRHVELAAFELWLPMLAGWGRLSQGLVIAEVQRRLQVSIEYVGGDE